PRGCGQAHPRDHRSLRSGLVGEEAPPARKAHRLAAGLGAPAQGRGRAGRPLERAQRDRRPRSCRRPQHRDCEGQFSGGGGTTHASRLARRGRDRERVASPPRAFRLSRPDVYFGGPYVVARYSVIALASASLSGAPKTLIILVTTASHCFASPLGCMTM